MKNWSLVTKEASNRQHRTQGRPNHTHNPPNNFPRYQTHQKWGCTWLSKEHLHIYVTFGQKPKFIRGFWPKTCVYTRLLAKNPRMYVNFGQKPTYTEKTVVKIRARVKPIKGSVNGWTYYKMQHRNKEKQRASQEYQAHYAPNPQRKTRNVLDRVTNFVTEKTSYGLGCTTTDRVTTEINPFPICKRNKICNTKGSRNIPYSGWLM